MKALIRRKKEQSKQPAGRPEGSFKAWWKPRKAASQKTWQRITNAAADSLSQSSHLGKRVALKSNNKKRGLQRGTGKSHQVGPDMGKLEIVTSGASRGAHRDEPVSKGSAPQIGEPQRQAPFGPWQRESPCSGMDETNDP